jgi:hypothetical protein
MRKPFYILMGVVLLFSSIVPGGLQGAEVTSTALADAELQSEEEATGMPARTAPAQPSPYHEPGHLSTAAEYTTWVDQVNPEGFQESVQLTGLQALMADGALNDPLAENYNLVNLDKALIGFYTPYAPANFSLQTYSVTPTIGLIPGSQVTFGDFRSQDVTAGDLNGDAVDEQIAAWINPTDGVNHIFLDIGDMQGVTTNTKTTSAPAAVLRSDGVLDLVVRGYDGTLWHRQYDLAADNWGGWDNQAGGLLLSAPAITSRGENQVDVFALGIDDTILPNYLVIWSNHWEDGVGWDGWEVLDNPDELNPPDNWPTLDKLVPTPLLPAPAAVARGEQLDLFWLWPDNTLQHSYYNGSSWDAWENLGGSLTTSPGAVALDANQMTVFAGGVEGSLWYLEYNGSWGAWNRLPLNNMASGVTIASAPTVVSPLPGNMTVYVRGSDNLLWQNRYDGTGWEDEWTSGGGVLASGVGAAVSQATNTTYLFAQDPEASLQLGIAAGSGLPAWQQGWSWLENCCQNQPYDTNTYGFYDAGSVQEDYINNISIRTGHLFGDGREQIVLAYRTSVSEVALQVYDIKDGFIPTPLLSIPAVQTGKFPKLTLGDFNKDGVDEIGLFYFNHLLNNVAVAIFSLDTTDWVLELIALAEYPLLVTDELCIPPDSSLILQYPERTFNIESGDLDGNGDAEIVISWDMYGYCRYFGLLDVMGYQARFSVLDLVNDVITAPYSVSNSRMGWDDIRCCSANIELAVGDVDGNGADEVIRTWPRGWDDNDWPDLYRNIQVIDASILMTPTLMADYAVPGWARTTWQDALAVGDLDRDLVDEIVFYESDADYDADWDKLWFYDYWEGALQQMGDPLFFNPGFQLFPLIATGDFTGESLRVGPPTYRKQYSVGGITAIINAPPKHMDIVNGVTYDINSQDEETRAELTLGEGSTTNVSIATTREFSLGLDFVTTIGDPEATHTKDSIGMSYGSNFEKTEGTFATVEFEETRTASNDDALFYMRTDYEVWEYPVYFQNSTTPASYLTVVFPMDTPRMRVERGNTCDSWYRSRHQLDNVWSYPETSDSFLDLAELISSRSDYLVSSDPSNFSYLFETGEVSRYSSKVEWGASNEFEWQIGGEEIEFSLFDIVSFSTRLPSFMMSTKTAYNESELSTLEITTNTSTQVDGFLNGVPNADDLGYDYAIRPYLYWSTNGAMVLDYTTSPEGTFWDNYADPDPAFILPWENGQCGVDVVEFTRDVINDPPVASEGQTITTTAVVRNFSDGINSTAFQVDFYQGNPGYSNSWIGAQTIEANDLGPREVMPVSIQWTATGMGEQHIYAVIDQLNALDEVHDQNDADVNNNIGYGLLRMGDVDFVDIGLAGDQPYYATSYALRDTLQVSFYIPPGNLPETARFDFQDALLGMGGVVGNPFELAAYIGSATNPWENVIPNYDLRPGELYPTAAIVIGYGNSDIAGMSEDNLQLLRKTNAGWENATCQGYAVQRFVEDNLLVVPICETGIFALSVGTPYWPTLLPIVSR